MKIGLVPNSINLSHPADRRRIWFYIKKTGSEFEIANIEKWYQYLYISISADFSFWSQYKEMPHQQNLKTKIIFDFCDYLIPDNWVNAVFRAAYLTFLGKNKRFNITYSQMLFSMFASADVVVCGSLEQKELLSDHHKNVVVIRDFFSDEIRSRKENYSLVVPNEINIFWEGLSHGNIEIFRMLKEVLEDISSHRVRLHIVTDSVYCRVGARYLCQSTHDVLSKIFKGSNTKFHLYDWCENTLSAIASSCDVAILPIPNQPVMRMKPENKLLLLWELGLPVIASNLRSYSRVMTAAGLKHVACDRVQFVKMLKEMIACSDLREQYSKKSKIYIQKNCSAEIILSQWGEVI